MDQFQDKAKKGFEFLRERASEAVEAQKLSSKVRQLEKRRDECILDLGHRVFVMFEMDRFDPDSLKDRVDEIRDLNHQLEQTMEEARQVKDQLRHSVEEVLPKRQAINNPNVPPPPDYSQEPGEKPPVTTVLEDEGEQDHS